MFESEIERIEYGAQQTAHCGSPRSIMGKIVTRLNSYNSKNENNSNLKTRRQSSKKKNRKK